MQLQQVEVSDSRAVHLEGYSGHRRSADPRAVLEEVFGLLEDYGPAFYTEELHDKIVAVLLTKEM